MTKYISLILIFLAVCISSSAQELHRPKSKAKPSEAVNDTAPKPIRKSTAWTLSQPLGEHVKATVDTLQYNYQRAFIPSFASDAYATTGTLGTEGINMIFFNRPGIPTFFFERSLDATLPSLKKFKFYNVYTPMTLLSYNYGGNKQNHADRLHATFAGNVNRNIGIGAFVDYNYSKGAYTRQATKGLSFGFSFYYNSHRYEGQAQYYQFNNLNQENGGITDIRYITDPAEVQGGVESVEPKSIPVNLSAARSRLSGNRLFTTHAFKVGYWTEEQVNDTLTRDVYVPLMKFVYSLDYENNHHNFTNTNVNQGREFWKNTYLSADGTNDHTRYWSVTNTIGVQLLEGFKKWAKFGISAYASLQTRGLTQANFYTPLPELPTT
ncbi:MAG: putative porin, partial [Muribaculaceae bacterium]|nr:putative porin [Muribaculaceae bacterium]